MQIGGTEQISHSAQTTFLALRDRQHELVRHLPNIEALSVLERNETPPTTRLYSRWQGSAGEIPAALRPLISREMLAWFDEAVWNAETLACQWRLESAKARDIFTCTGTTTLKATGEGSCAFHLSAELHVYPEHVPGVPGFLARRVREPLEQFVANLLRPNLTSVAKAVQTYLDAAPPAAS
ncbi:MAG: hypothetical protein IPL40_01490 [Proteobacteria bacterium]|nr:hypothetical protein [Pseudomonadota bacterium]